MSFLGKWPIGGAIGGQRHQKVPPGASAWVELSLNPTALSHYLGLGETGLWEMRGL
jgi:hypothetical protein